MIKPTGFMKYDRDEITKRPVTERVQDFREFEKPLSLARIKRQARRCMDCGIPFCHGYGCPVHNLIPEWMELVAGDNWADALDLLHHTDNFPEITGRVCPAPCEAACTLSINREPVMIRHIELQIIERGFENGLVVPQVARRKTGKRVAIIGSGPAGLAAAQQVARCGHETVVFEKADRVGGLLRYGIPDFKLEKAVIDRRLAQMAAEGVTFETGVDVGYDISARFLRKSFDAVILAMGAPVPRDLDVPGRELAGVHFAMDFLTQQNRRVAGLSPSERSIEATGKHVVVIGGGDTGSDCVGTAIRQGAASVTQIEILPEPPEQRPMANPWPEWPRTMRTSSSHEEGCERRWAVTTKKIRGKGGHVTGLTCRRVNWDAPGDNAPFTDVRGSGFELRADLVLLAMGFLRAPHGSLVRDLGIELDERGNFAVDGAMTTSQPGVFAAGDSVTGAYLVVGAIHSGRQAAAGAIAYLADD